MEFWSSALELLLGLGAFALLLPCAVLFLECVAASERAAGTPLRAGSLPRTTVLIPAHDEAAGIAAALESVQAAAFAEMDVLVVADNCADATAEIARAAGVRVVERNHPAQYGKDFALAFGFESLRAEPPAVVIVLDADCIVERDALQQLAVRAATTARPVQAAYLLNPILNASPKTALAVFAFRVKNLVRPLGLRRWGAPCLLTGTGMAFPWQAVQHLSATGHLSEDMWWSVELTCAGYAPLFCPDALVYSESPRRAAILKMQRARWERGHLVTMQTGIPKLLQAAARQRRAEPLWLAWELGVPPLALLVCMVALCCVVAGVLRMVGVTVFPFVLTLMNFLLLTAALAAAWWKFGRTDIPARTLFAVPGYILWKMPLYFEMLRRRRVTWARTTRGGAR